MIFCVFYLDLILNCSLSNQLASYKNHFFEPCKVNGYSTGLYSSSVMFVIKTNKVGWLDMFNNDLKKNAIASLERAQKSYEGAVKGTRNRAEELFNARQRCSNEVLTQCEAYINALANNPKEYDKGFQEFKAEISIFDGVVRKLEIEIRDANFQAGTTVGAGIATGAGVAAFAPTAAMAIATTFGTASTGTAIASLSGAAATNAALAWLGGGAIAAGGGGMAGGSALLAFAGPIGWTIGVTALATGGFMARKKNAEIAAKANAEEKKIRTAIAKTNVITASIVEILKPTYTHLYGMLSLLEKLRDHAPKDYREFNDHQKDQLLALHNHMLSLSKLINKNVEA